MKNNKGFTLVELIAMLVVLGILMAVTVPNITGILNQQKETAFVEEAEKLVSTAQMKMATDKKIKRPTEGKCLVMSMEYLDKAKEISKAADGGTYLREDSFVIIRRVGAKLEYHVRLVETTTGGDIYGIDTTEITVLEKEGTTVLSFYANEGYNMHIATPDSISSMDPFTTLCDQGIVQVYN